MSIAQIIPLVEPLPRTDKFQLIQILLSQLAQRENYPLQAEASTEMERGKRMAVILQRMADRRTLSSISDPVAWQREIREDRVLPGRE